MPVVDIYLLCRRGFFDKRLSQEVSGDLLGDVSSSIPQLCESS